MIFGAFFFCLAVVSLLPLILISLGQCVGDFPTKMHCLISTHDSLILSIGTLSLVSCLALFTTYVSSVSSERRDVYNRRIQAELQIARFRQDWINAMHRDLSDIYKLMVNERTSAEFEIDELAKLVFAIQARLNRDNPPAKAVWDQLDIYFRVSRNKEDELYLNFLASFPLVVNEFLKVEWDRLKADLQNAQSIEIGTQ